MLQCALQNVAVCCSVLVDVRLLLISRHQVWCVALCCSVFAVCPVCITVYCSVLQSVLQYGAACCSEFVDVCPLLISRLQIRCVAGCCSMLQCVLQNVAVCFAVCCSVLQRKGRCVSLSILTTSGEVCCSVFQCVSQYVAVCVALCCSLCCSE